jgi:hypothetical protein
MCVVGAFVNWLQDSFLSPYFFPCHLQFCFIWLSDVLLSRDYYHCQL